ncbi:uncharacterized protein BJ212DRAFT_745528 [Suillus subaureus]|uniref:Uncharacterized protein n=1 Tax=Suillus subaureus TaxID=48587 RepID=A0A9P7DZU5_9AGAM|nr:uncharacterized protein BJ212DRAFT_745528 [Suillus subaureus]KAG1807452.1 hypothetical protein BJ212DRAFT_745528 [Suillus subaureus]
MFRKLTLVGAPEKLRVDCLLVMLAVASFQVPVVDFQTGTTLSTVHMNNIMSLLSVVREVTYHGHLLQIEFATTRETEATFLDVHTDEFCHAFATDANMWTSDYMSTPSTEVLYLTPDFGLPSLVLFIFARMK